MKLMISADTQNLNLITNGDNDGETGDREKRIETLQQELNQLSVIDKALISLMLEGLSMREIAEIIGITEPNVKVKIHRIKNHLKERLKIDNHEQ